MENTTIHVRLAESEYLRLKARAEAGRRPLADQVRLEIEYAGDRHDEALEKEAHGRLVPGNLIAAPIAATNHATKSGCGGCWADDALGEKR